MTAHRPELVATIPSLIRSAAERFATRPFVVTPEHVLTFGDAERQSRRLAKRLVRGGIGKGTHVGLLFPQGPDVVVALLAVTRIGATAVPLSTFLRAPELRAAIRHADVDTLLVPRTLLGRDLATELESVWTDLAGAPGPDLFLTEAPFLRHVWVCGGSDRLWAISTPEVRMVEDDGEVGDDLLEAIESEVSPADPMVMVFTSGATAEPKAVVHTHGAQVRQSRVLAELYAFDGTERTFTTMPFFWVGGLTVTLLTHLHRGGTVITVDRMDVPRMLDLIERTRPTRLVGWTLLERLTADPASRGRDLAWLADLQTPGLRHPGRRHGSLGMTETGGPHTAPPAELSGVELTDELRGSFGPPVEGFEHKIVDAETGRVLEDGQEGEICVRGDRMMTGLHKRERSQTFDDDGWYRTGDHGYLRDGLLFFTGRRSAMIKTGGANVSPQEVELAMRSLPGVRAAFVVGLPDQDRGELVGCLVCAEPGHELDATALTAQLSEQLSSYKVPKRILIVEYDDVPWLPSGKVSLPRVIERLLA
jgi:acyl-CoA synthetase (AMP-forming)/AMP-acid ligase II